MNDKSRKNFSVVLAFLLALILMAGLVMTPTNTGLASSPDPRPTAVSPGIDQNGQGTPDGLPEVTSLQSESLNTLSSTDPCTFAFQGGGDRLAALQNYDGGWDWPLDNGDPNSGSASNTIGPIAMGLAHAYLHTGNSAHQDALLQAGTFLLAKTNFSPSDGYLAAQLDLIFGGTTYVDHVQTYFYDELANGSYERNGILYDTEEYVNLIRETRAAQGIPNLAAWDIGMGLVGAASAGADTTAWIAGVKAEIDELDGNAYYDVIGLAGAVYGLAFVGENFDPTAGEHASANSLSDLASILAGYQIEGGGFTWNKNYLTPGESNETIQETAYAVLALNEFDRTTYFDVIQGAADYMKSVQLATGGWKNWEGGGENNEVTSEALWGISVAQPGPATSNVVADPNPVPVGGSVALTAMVDDTGRGCSNIVSAEYNLDGGAAWPAMDAQDGTFDSVSEVVEVNFTAPTDAGIYDLCARGTDAVGNTGPEECTMLVVYDPEGGFVTGGGWIDSPPGAYKTSVPFDISGNSATMIYGDYTGYFARYTDAVCDPNNSPITFSGSVDVTGLQDNGAVFIGLVDKQWVDEGNTGYMGGAYAYFGRRGNNIIVGPTDGNLGGEIVQTFATLFDYYDPSGTPPINFSAVIYDGSVIVTLDGVDYVDDYGFVKTLNNSSPYSWDEFEHMAYVGVDSWPPENAVLYDVTVNGCDVIGKATFGFVSKYKKGATVPEGNTEFVFKAASLNFHSSSYDWLVVTGSDYAKFKGAGTINGMGDYKFMLWAGDGEPDTFRIKIWEEDEYGNETVIYDNGFDQEIAGGSIVIHTSKK